MRKRFLITVISLTCIPSVMSFVGYDYHKEKSMLPEGDWQSLTDEELPTGDVDY